MKFHGKSADYETVKNDIQYRKQSGKRSQKTYKNGMVDVVLF